MTCFPCEEVQRLCDKESPPLWIQTLRPLKEVSFGLVGMLEIDKRYPNIVFFSPDEQETTGARWAKSKPQSFWEQQRRKLSGIAGVTVLL